MVPTEYGDLTDTAYKQTMRATLDPAVVVMWTGTDVVPVRHACTLGQRISPGPLGAIAAGEAVRPSPALPAGAVKRPDQCGRARLRRRWPAPTSRRARRAGRRTGRGP
ncbi:beta-N-acetylglucosaminidase domain-containing protein [Nonomuraea polychroma]|uniref:beta-N-acetylglucosaminidase domain-containing protein n=1 Tax=Nonomuraea polychroma TaxID=46176 RepID=UPI0019D4B35D